MISLFISGAVVAVGYVGYRYRRLLWRGFRTGKVGQVDAVEQPLLADAAQWLAPRLGASPEAIDRALVEASGTGRCPPLVKPVRRIECAYEKTRPDCCRLTLGIVLAENGDTVLHRLTRDVAWEDLPREIRRDFLRPGNLAQRFLLIDQK